MNKDSNTHKDDAGKLRISLVPTQIIKDIAEVREYGNKKYGDPDGWMMVAPERYVDALLRHTLEFMKDPVSVDPESGIPHYKHMACNLAFLCDMYADIDYLQEMCKKEEFVYGKTHCTTGISNMPNGMV